MQLELKLLQVRIDEGLLAQAQASVGLPKTLVQTCLQMQRSDYHYCRAVEECRWATHSAQAQ